MESVSSNALDWSLSHIERYGDSDFFPPAFEFKAIRHCWTRIRKELEAVDLANYTPHSPRRMAVPKPGGGFRIVCQLDPIDSLLYTALVFEACPQIEASRVAAERLVACSYRINPQADGSLFASQSGWPEYHQQSKKLSGLKVSTYVLTADITDFYNQASHHRIENALELANVPAARAKVIEGFLTALAAKQSRGLPVGPAASIVLAEACLNDVDMFIIRRGLAHTRYVDDIRIFCRNYRDAMWTLYELTDYLYTAHRLALNASKTRIMTRKNFAKYELLDPEEEEERGRLDHINQLIQAGVDKAGGYDAFMELGETAILIIDEAERLATNNSIKELFISALESKIIRVGLARHVLRRAAQLRTTSIHKLVMDNLPSPLKVGV